LPTNPVRGRGEADFSSSLARGACAISLKDEFGTEEGFARVTVNYTTVASLRKSSSIAINEYQLDVVTGEIGK
jgi:hypothetical protein